MLVAARRRGDAVVLQVWDSGVGTRSEARDRVFDEFVQVARSAPTAPDAGRRKGLGLGLAIVRPLIRPQLGFRRREVLDFLAALGQDFREDPSNQDRRFTRNRLRHELIPLLSSGYNAQVVEALLRLGEDATHWNLTDTPGFLRIILQPCNIAADGRARNFLVRDVPDGDFQIETFVRFEPSSNFQFAGLLIYETQGKAMQFGRAFANCGFEACKGNAIYFDLADPGAVSPPNFVTPVDETSQAWLRLIRKGNQYESYYSTDGEAWTMIGVHTSNIAPVYVGLIGSQAYEGETTADFDYFAMERIP